MYARSSSPPDTASGGLGKEGWSEIAKIDDSFSCNAVVSAQAQAKLTLEKCNAQVAPMVLSSIISKASSSPG
jgi:hypothetical protein